MTRVPFHAHHTATPVVRDTYEHVRGRSSKCTRDPRADFCVLWPRVHYSMYALESLRRITLSNSFLWCFLASHHPAAAKYPTEGSHQVVRTRFADQMQLRLFHPTLDLRPRPNLSSCQATSSAGCGVSYSQVLGISTRIRGYIEVPLLQPYCHITNGGSNAARFGNYIP